MTDSAAPRSNILVVEDDKGVQRTLQLVLERAGHRVQVVGTGADAFDIIGRERVDLVITDILMPDMDGIEVIQRIRELSAQLPILAISGGDVFGGLSLEDALLLGATRTLHKPIELADLLATVEDLLGGRG